MGKPNSLSLELPFHLVVSHCSFSHKDVNFLDSFLNHLSSPPNSYPVWPILPIASTHLCFISPRCSCQDFCSCLIELPRTVWPLITLSLPLATWSPCLPPPCHGLSPSPVCCTYYTWPPFCTPPCIPSCSVTLQLFPLGDGVCFLCSFHLWLQRGRLMQ